ncbi:MAG: hypothetical protein EZS28_045417 [Streblomastix strix]|uniref:Uncharacterized protein n=1 Tax=Streblomastix strix TaxID=222440 RepID=A0A5J4TKP3_9EUKA|nr:MAG: hypothetical protein EZS28_045417 [Streblomastix strix]
MSSTQETPASPLSLPIISTQPIVEARYPNDRESTRCQESRKQKDDQVVQQQSRALVSSMTKKFDKAGNANAQL